MCNYTQLYSHTLAQQVLAAHVCCQGSHTLVTYAVMPRWLLEEITAGWKRCAHVHTKEGEKAQFSQRQTVTPETTPVWQLKYLLRVIVLIIGFCWMSSLVKREGVTESIIAFD